MTVFQQSNDNQCAVCLWAHVMCWRGNLEQSADLWQTHFYIFTTRWIGKWSQISVLIFFFCRIVNIIFIIEIGRLKPNSTINRNQEVTLSPFNHSIRLNSFNEIIGYVRRYRAFPIQRHKTALLCFSIRRNTKFASRRFFFFTFLLKFTVAVARLSLLHLFLPSWSASMYCSIYWVVGSRRYYLKYVYTQLTNRDTFTIK